jgi:hypothetical protein
MMMAVIPAYAGIQAVSIAHDFSRGIKKINKKWD